MRLQKQPIFILTLCKLLQFLRHQYLFILFLLSQVNYSVTARLPEMLLIELSWNVALDSLSILIFCCSKSIDLDGIILFELCKGLVSDLYHPFSQICCLQFAGIIRYEAGIKIKFKDTMNNNVIRSVHSSLSLTKQ